MKRAGAARCTRHAQAQAHAMMSGLRTPYHACRPPVPGACLVHRQVQVLQPPGYHFNWPAACGVQPIGLYDAARGRGHALAALNRCGPSAHAQCELYHHRAEAADVRAEHRRPCKVHKNAAQR